MPEPSRVGPLLSRHLGDRRFLLMLPRALGLQVLDPAIAAALTEHAPSRLWEHKKRTVNQMIYMAHMDRDMAAVIRNGHEHVKGVGDDGARYHALNPEVFLFQHATYVESLLTAAAVFGPPIPESQRVQFYRECCDWYRGYGISDRALPGSLPDFAEYFESACTERLRLTPAGEVLAAQVLRPDAWLARNLPAAAVRAMQHERVAELLGVRVGRADRVALRTVAAGVRLGFAGAPGRICRVPQARIARMSGHL
ncbi:oxygenase MpaB family protein [Nocardia sp. NPDC005978]|uniref:oxygenase MpaB family protein n=1 Tax=Nocardia sp. NPDC005978 TaxID=3156725 RepID=UPI0033B3724C